MQELEKEIIEWHISTFPFCTIEGQIRKFEEERQEMEKADNYRDYANELADCYISAISLLRYAEVGSIIKEVFIKYIDNIREDHESWFIDRYDIVKFIKNKLEINKKRKWKFDAKKGVYHHE